MANRVANIQEILPRHHWNHVSTAENPADIASRGAKVSDLLENELWWKGPPWLLNDETNWPRYKAIVEESLEKREPKKVLTSIIPSHFIELERFSSFLKLVRVLLS